MRIVLLLAAGGLLATAPLLAQVRPTPGPGDPRIQTIDYQAEQVVLVEGMPGYQVTVQLSPDEQVENVAVGDSGAWQVTANHRGDHLFIKAVQSGVGTNMTVVTNIRLYNFELAPLYDSAAEMPYTIRFRYPGTASEDAGAETVAGRYQLTGDKALRPDAIHDDGRQTYMSWPRDRGLPAVYAIDDQGRETIVNGMMRDDVFVIDGVAPKLVFRIDNHVAGAERVELAQ